LKRALNAGLLIPARLAFQVVDAQSPLRVPVVLSHRVALGLPLCPTSKLLRNKISSFPRDGIT